MTPSLFTALFLAALLISVATRGWLAVRQIRHVGANRGAVPPHFADRITLAAHQKAADYTTARTRLGLADTALDTVLLLALTLGGGIALIAAWSATLPLPAIWRELTLIVATMLLSSAVALPLAWYRTFVIEQRFGFNRMTLGLWLLDMVKAALLAAVLGVPLLLLVLWLMERAGAWWWFYVWIAWVLFQFLMMAIYPTWIAPLFNKFEPLTDTGVRERVERLLARCGFAAKGLFVMDGSKRSSHGNAYFTGFGAAKRIVFFDTLLSRLRPDEVEAVLAHEVGHFKRRHVLQRLAWYAGASFGLLALLAWLIGEPWFYVGLGVAAPDPASRNGMALLLFFLVLPVFLFLLAPLGSLYSRRQEFEADAFAAANASASALIAALVKLYEDNANTLTPDPLHSAFYDSHPPAALRIARLQPATQ